MQAAILWFLGHSTNYKGGKLLVSVQVARQRKEDRRVMESPAREPKCSSAVIKAHEPLQGFTEGQMGVSYQN